MTQRIERNIPLALISKRFLTTPLPDEVSLLGGPPVTEFPTTPKVLAPDSITTTTQGTAPREDNRLPANFHQIVMDNYEPNFPNPNAGLTSTQILYNNVYLEGIKLTTTLVNEAWETYLTLIRHKYDLLNLQFSYCENWQELCEAAQRTRNHEADERLRPPTFGSSHEHSTLHYQQLALGNFASAISERMSHAKLKPGYYSAFEIAHLIRETEQAGEKQKAVIIETVAELTNRLQFLLITLTEISKTFITMGEEPRYLSPDEIEPSDYLVTMKRLYLPDCMPRVIKMLTEKDILPKDAAKLLNKFAIDCSLGLRVWNRKFTPGAINNGIFDLHLPEDEMRFFDPSSGRIWMLLDEHELPERLGLKTADSTESDSESVLKRYPK